MRGLFGRSTPTFAKQRSTFDTAIDSLIAVRDYAYDVERTARELGETPLVESENSLRNNLIRAQIHEGKACGRAAMHISQAIDALLLRDEEEGA